MFPCRVPVSRWCGALVLALAGVVGAPAGAVAEGSTQSVPVTQRLLVKLSDSTLATGGVQARRSVRALSLGAGVALRHVRRMAGEFELVELPAGTSATEARTVAQRLMQDPGVEYAEPDRWMRAALTPNDPHYFQQWHLHEAISEIAAANSPGAWDVSTGLPAVVVAVIDTGLVRHADLEGARILPGYDFISDLFVANDGDGRDPDPSDPGDWVSDEEIALYGDLCAESRSRSSWHGTQIAGVIGATGNNGAGIAGVNWGSKLLPVRVLGKCGGWMSDVIDALRWAAGISVPGPPVNAEPARVINLSLGSKGPCSPFLQRAIDNALAAGAVVVAAAGNSLDPSTVADAADLAPGNCAGVIAAGAVDRLGNRAWYSRTGETVSLSAPGLAWSVSNLGTTSPAPGPDGNGYVVVAGTSISAAQVSGVISLMLSVNPVLTPSQVGQVLRAAARNFPDGSSCISAHCGAGMLDARAAVRAASVVPTFASAGATGNGGGGGGCFIATAAYGTPSATEVTFLRRFRDRYLLTNAIGRAFVNAYYKLSPSFARAIRPYPLLRRLVRIGLVPCVALARGFVPDASE